MAATQSTRNVIHLLLKTLQLSERMTSQIYGSTGFEFGSSELNASVLLLYGPTPGVHSL